MKLSIYEGSAQFLIIIHTLIPSKFISVLRAPLETSKAIDIFEKLCVRDGGELFARKKEIPCCTNVCAPNA